MKYFFIPSIVTLFFLPACSLDSIYTPGTSIGSGTSVSTGAVQPPLTENLSGSSDEYNPIFQGLETKIIRIKHTTGKPTKIAFINSEAKLIHIKIDFPTSSGANNLRLNQIVLPDGTMDGPFGQDTQYPLSQFGGYEFLFHESLMAGNPWSGVADITMTLSK